MDRVVEINNQDQWTKTRECLRPDFPPPSAQLVTFTGPKLRRGGNAKIEMERRLNTACLRAKNLISVFLPSLYKDIPHHNIASFTDHYRNIGMAYQKNKRPVIDFMFSTKSWGKECFRMKNGDFMRSDVWDLVLYMHEYAHLLFNSYAGYTDTDPQYAHRSLTEGFAEVLTYVVATKMIQHMHEIGLDQSFVDSLSSFKRDSFLSLRQNSYQRKRKKAYFEDQSYTEGVFYFFHDLFRNHSEEEIVGFLKNLDVNKLRKITRRSMAYKKIIALPTVEERFRQFSKDHLTQTERS